MRRSGARRGTPARCLVVGLGNPGSTYAGTRHNVGADTVTLLAERFGVRMRPEIRSKALIAEVPGSSIALPEPRDGPVGLALPTTFMNDSGDAVIALVRRFSVDDLRRLVIVHDELDLAPGIVRIKMGGGIAGHNGLRSIRERLGAEDFARVRIGVGKPPSKDQGADYVLRRPSGDDRRELSDAIALAADAVEAMIASGAEFAMTRYNGS